MQFFKTTPFVGARNLEALSSAHLEELQQPRGQAEARLRGKDRVCGRGAQPRGRGPPAWSPLQEPPQCPPRGCGTRLGLPFRPPIACSGQPCEQLYSKGR